ncbi:FeoA family protein [Corynebacterium glyciniphilum]|uniref:FeoA family protein n=1 Tax=Corynebacterium glyciniphilum TaxID=1404244 RepID=UPI003DA123CA
MPATVLSARAAGEPVQVVRVSDENPDILRFLSDRGIAIGSVIQVNVAMSSTGLMTVRRDDHTLELSTPIATSVHVTPA